MKTVVITDEIRRAAPHFRMVLIEAAVTDAPTPDELWAEIEAAAAEVARLPMEAVNKRPAIAATRAAYKALGKEPNRYRPSAEALCRRCVKGVGLYRSLAIIDLINLVSLRTGHSIGAFDADRIEGDTLTLGVGRPGEPYEAIGRGQLNIEHLPVYRDAAGGIGTPTSDNDRTKLTAATTRLLVTLNMYDGADDGALDLTMRLLRQYAGATDIQYHEYN
ncbi:MAG: phenylalanine--tRNA ligase beta subunit-related protein [Bacteroides sp.]|nr:phenylalanine--tRNA ligase beta subunit-related protein [Bacteroides sp.]MCM1094814.1 phenylalanine--tRNA ligase beta subunit-related protein [Terasakiella sp.]